MSIIKILDVLILKCVTLIIGANKLSFSGAQVTCSVPHADGVGKESGSGHSILPWGWS